ncbi:hypothetical protein EFD55_26280 [Rhizobium pisi]|uniref:Uncharacterized protein n=1 Tax=Rhizobium pisi TaxID=574561 RepID=A0A3R9BNC7_9HYPH|nr:hypothetical protein EFD55_26280 [Rhizobium pisi]
MIATSDASLASIAATVSQPKGMQTGGSGTSANATTCLANLSLKRVRVSVNFPGSTPGTGLFGE